MRKNGRKGERTLPRSCFMKASPPCPVLAGITPGILFEDPCTNGGSAYLRAGRHGNLCDNKPFCGNFIPKRNFGARRGERGSLIKNVSI